MDQIYTDFSSDGYVVVKNTFESDRISSLYDAVINRFHEIRSIISEQNLEFGIGIKHGFKEIVQRHPSRFEMPYGIDNSQFDFLLENEYICELISNLLQCNDYIVANRSAVISLPGCGEQSWHSDGPHMSATEHLPCHCVNLFIPLVDVTQLNGPTEFRPASHFYTRDLAKSFLLALAKKTVRKIESPTMKTGSVLLFDYRVLHRGAANRSDSPRPIIVFTFAKPWFKDVLNFPTRSVFEASTETGEEKNS